MSADPEPPPPEPEEQPLGAGIDFSDPNSPLAPFYFQISDVFLVLVCGLAGLLYSHLPLYHTDVWVHLKFGQRILETRQLPETEPFSPYTDHDAKLVNVQWLTQVLYAAAFQTGESRHTGDPAARWLGGAEALRQLHTLGVVAFFGLMAVALRRASGSGPVAVVGLALLVAACFFAVGFHRPQTFGLTCFAAVLALVSRPEPTRRAYILLPLVMALWANLHGSFAVGFVLLGVLTVGRFADAVLRHGWSAKAAAADRAFFRVAVGLLASLAAVAVLNPYGPKLYAAVLAFGSNPNLKVLDEWQPLDVLSAKGGAVLYWALVGLNALAVAARPKAATAARVLAVLAFAVPPLLQQRMLSWLVPVGVWALAGQIGAVLAARNWTLPASVPSFKKTLLAALVPFPMVMLNPLVQWAQNGPPTNTGIVHPETPFDLAGVLRNPAAPASERLKPLAAALREHYPDKPVGPVFARQELGEFLLWADPPGCPTLLCTHAHLYPVDHWRKCSEVMTGEPWAVLTLDRYGVNLVALDSGGKPAAMVARDANWLVVLNEAGGPGRNGLFVAVRKRR